MPHSHITGTGSYLPEKVLTNEDLARRVETSDEWITTRTGIKTRHIAADDETTSDLSLKAAHKAMEAAGVTAKDLDFIVVATFTPDAPLPSAACMLQAKLGATGSAAFDLQAACSGFVYSLALVDKMVSTGQSKCALVVGADVLSGVTDWNDRKSCVLFGDGAGAAIVQPSKKPGILSSHLHADGSLGPLLKVNGGLRNGKFNGHPFMEMEGQAVFKVAVRVLEDVCREALDFNGMSADQVDWFIPHQSNMRILSAAAERLGLPMERVMQTVAHQGNTSAASVPLALDEAVRDGRIRKGHHVLLAGVGGGMTWGSLLMRW
jgi:3-oxoacyl-[acyl-carrier-protein] synthase-3